MEAILYGVAVTPNGAYVYVTNGDWTVSVITVVPTVTATASAAVVDVGQSSTLSVTTDITGGTSPYSHQWMEAFNGGSFSSVGSATSSAESYIFNSAAMAVGTYTFELVVTDATGASVASNVVTVTVDSALTAPTVTATPTTVDQGQT